MTTKITSSRLTAPLVPILLLLLLLLISTSAHSETPNKLNDIRHRSGDNYTRVVLDLEKKGEYEYRLLKEDPSINKPARFYVDILGATLSSDAPRAIKINDGLLKAVRSGQYNPSTVRVVLDIESIEDYKIFQLPSPYRLVIDVMGTGARKAAEAKKKTAGTKTSVKRKDAAGSSAIKASSKEYMVKTIVIDPGHGGKDPGAVGKRKLLEKDVTLKLAKLLKVRLASKIKSNIILTRDRDVFIPLDERTAIANSKEADLFISIHVNASPNRRASGIETYYLSNTSDKDAIRVAARENKATEEEMEDIVQYILQDMTSNANQNESIRLATLIQEDLTRQLSSKYKGIKSNGVKGALFYVLVNSHMPSVLVEVSFISNPTEESRLRSDKYLDTIVDGITKAVLKYISGI